MEHQQRQERLSQVRKEYDSPESLNEDLVEYWTRRKK
jgi:hypothetical protein